MLPVPAAGSDEMQTDRTTKFLLAMIALALWANLLKGAFTPAPAVAQINGLAQPVRIIASDLVLPVNITRQAQPLDVKVIPDRPTAVPGR
jgi:hypothetical protein